MVHAPHNRDSGHSKQDHPQPSNFQDRDAREVQRRLAALGAHMRGRHLNTDLNDGSLTVAVPGKPEDDTVACTITCRPRPSDGDRYWYWNGQRQPIAEAEPEHIPDAGARIAADLRARQQS